MPAKTTLLLKWNYSPTPNLMSKPWECILHASGGALEISKCFTYMVLYDWTDGRYHLRKPTAIEGRVTLTDSESSAQHTLACIDPAIGKRTIGIQIAPAGN
jgi:hypothetical protein